MNKIIYLEPDEEIINIVDRLKTIPEKKIALVVPSGAVLVSSAINLRLLQEESEKLGKEISIVTTDSTGRNIATQLGFTVYENLGAARENRVRDLEEQERSPLVRKRIPEKKLEEIEEDDLEGGYTDMDEEEYHASEKIGTKKASIFDEFDEEEEERPVRKKEPVVVRKKLHPLISNPKAWIFGTMGFILILFLLVFVFPKATVYLNVAAAEENLDIDFKLATDVTTVSKSDNKVVLPANWESKDEEVVVSVPTTGAKNVGDKAKGIVVIYNRSGKTVNISAGTQFLTSDNKVFVIPQAASVPGAVVSEYGEMIAGKSSTNLEAGEGGTAYNINPSRFYIPSLADITGNLVYGQTEDALVGGTDKNAQVVSKDDIDKAKQMAKDQMDKKQSDEFGMQGEKLFVQGLGVVANNNETMDKKEGDEADKLTLDVKTTFSFLTFSKIDFDKMFADSLKLNIGSQKELVGTGYRSVSWDVINFDNKKKQAELVAHVKILTAATINQDFLKSKIVTLSIPELRTVLSQYTDVELDHVSFFPPLLIQSIPSNERNVNIVVNHVEK